MNRPHRTLLCGILAALTLSAPALAAGRSIPVQVDGRQILSDARLEAGVTYVPLRTLLDALDGWELHWDSNTRQAVAQGKGASLQADPAADSITVNGRQESAKVYVQNGRTYVPLRLTAEALGHQVEWDSRMDGAAVTSAGAPFRAVDLYWLSHVIYAESGAESMRGQIAVGNVVLNRVASSEFPNSIPAVIFDTADGVQFEPLQNGTLFRTPSEESMEAARRALSGESAAGKALYFYAPALSSGLWIRSNRTYLMTIGCHRFYL